MSTNDKKTGKEVILAPGLGVLTKTSWTPPADLTFEKWEAAIDQFLEWHDGCQWWLGDAWVVGQQKGYGKRAQEVRAGKYGDYTFETLMVYGSVARRVPTLMRNKVLSFSHHALVAKFSEDKQRELLQRAATGDGKKRWNTKKLRSAILTDRRTQSHGKMAELRFDEKFTLVYCDPPWKFATRSDLGGEMTSADNHYPPMELQDICDLEIETSQGKKHISEIIADDAVMYMWATVPCLFFAPVVWNAWGFPDERLQFEPDDKLGALDRAAKIAGGYGSHAMWDKEISGTGYHFLNQHEILFRVARGEPPKPLKIFPSVFRYRKGKHSAKPPEIRKAIEEMYPMLDQHNRIELFARGKIPGWTVWGNEAVPSTLSPGSNVAPVDPKLGESVKAAVDELNMDPARREFLAAAEFRRGGK